jgi:hypothetical protein
MRRLVWIGVAVIALGAAGAAIAWHGAFKKTDKVAASFRATQQRIDQRTCVGSDGHTYRLAQVELAGEIDSADSRLDGAVGFRLRIREDVTAGLGTAEGRMWVDRGSDRTAGARVLAVVTGGTLNGLLDGRVQGGTWLLANFTGSFDSGGTLTGGFGDGSPSPANAAVVQSHLRDACKKPEESRTGKLEVRKELEPSSDPGRFDLYIGNTRFAAGVGDGSSTGEQTVRAATHWVSERAATGTNLRDYDIRIVCRDENGTGDVIASGGPDGHMPVKVEKDADVVCVITNTREND